MGFSSQAGQVILKTQSVQGTYDATTGTAGVGIKLRSGSLGTNRDLLLADPEIGGGRDRVDAYLGAASWSGDYEFYARMDALTTLLKAALGTAAAPVTTSGVTTHTLTPSDAAQLPFLSIEEAVGNGLEAYHYNDAVVNTLHLEAEANGFLMGTAGIVAAKQVAGVTKTVAPVWDNGPMVVGTNITVTYNAVTLPAKSFSLDINNNFEDDDFRLGSFYVGDLTPKGREVTASFSIRESSSALWRQATYGLSSATEVGGIPTKNQLVITCTTYENISGSTPLTPYSLTITIPSFMLSPYTLEASGDDIIESDIEGQALRPVAATPILTAVVKTGKATIS
ncbi:MAG TPA: phage tail tube protein [Candidatus Paceibacterota bacterium]